MALASKDLMKKKKQWQGYKVQIRKRCRECGNYRERKRLKLCRDCALSNG